MAQTYPDLDMYPDPDMDMSEILDVLLSEVYELYNQEPDVPAMNDAQTCPDPELGLSETEVYDLEQELAARGLPDVGGSGSLGNVGGSGSLGNNERYM